MKVLLTIWISAVIIQQVVPSTLVRVPRAAKSSVHTEYEAKYEQKGKHGKECSSTVKGNQELVHNDCGDTWNEFAEKCASLVKDLISSLANAVTSRPGDATNLHLNIKNSFRHFDNSNNCTDIKPVENCLSNLNLSSLFNTVTLKTETLEAVEPEDQGKTLADFEKLTPSGSESSTESGQQPDRPPPVVRIPEHLGVNPESEDPSGGSNTNNDRRETKLPPEEGIGEGSATVAPKEKHSPLPPFLKGGSKHEHPSFSSQYPVGPKGHLIYPSTNPPDDAPIEFSASAVPTPYQVRKPPRPVDTDPDSPDNGEKPLGPPSFTGPKNPVIRPDVAREPTLGTPETASPLPPDSLAPGKENKPVTHPPAVIPILPVEPTNPEPLNHVKDEESEAPEVLPLPPKPMPNKEGDNIGHEPMEQPSLPVFVEATEPVVQPPISHGRFAPIQPEVQSPKILPAAPKSQPSFPPTTFKPIDPKELLTFSPESEPILPGKQVKIIDDHEPKVQPSTPVPFAPVEPVEEPIVSDKTEGDPVVHPAAPVPDGPAGPIHKPNSDLPGEPEENRDDHQPGAQPSALVPVVLSEQKPIPLIKPEEYNQDKAEFPEENNDGHKEIIVQPPPIVSSAAPFESDNHLADSDSSHQDPKITVKLQPPVTPLDPKSFTEGKDCNNQTLMVQPPPAPLGLTEIPNLPVKDDDIDDKELAAQPLSLPTPVEPIETSVPPSFIPPEPVELVEPAVHPVEPIVPEKHPSLLLPCVKPELQNPLVPQTPVKPVIQPPLPSEPVQPVAGSRIPLTVVEPIESAMQPPLLPEPVHPVEPAVASHTPPMAVEAPAVQPPFLPEPVHPVVPLVGPPLLPEPSEPIEPAVNPPVIPPLPFEPVEPADLPPVSVEPVEAADHPPVSVEPVEAADHPPVSVEPVEPAEHPLVSIEPVEPAEHPPPVPPVPVSAPPGHSFLPPTEPVVSEKPPVQPPSPVEPVEPVPQPPSISSVQPLESSSHLTHPNAREPQHPVYSMIPTPDPESFEEKTSLKPTTFQTTSVEPTSPEDHSHLPPPTLTRPLTHTPSPYTSPEGFPLRPSTSPSLIYSSSKKPPRREDEEDDDDEEDDCCSCESCTEEPITDIREYRISACKDLEEARRELKVIFDKIKKKLRCGRKCGMSHPR